MNFAGIVVAPVVSGLILGASRLKELRKPVNTIRMCHQGSSYAAPGEDQSPSRAFGSEYGDYMVTQHTGLTL